MEFYNHALCKAKNLKATSTNYQVFKENKFKCIPRDLQLYISILKPQDKNL